MSLGKIVLIVIVVGVVIFISLLWYTLKDKVNDVSDDPLYKPLVNKPLSLAREMWLVKNFSPLAKFVPNFLSEKNGPIEERTPLLYKIQKGTKFSIHHFKTVKNGTSGFTSLYAVGKIYVEELKSDMDFEYDWPRNYSLLQNKYTSLGTPPWEPCPFDDDVEKQSLAELRKNFSEVQWDFVQGNAVVKVSSAETLRVAVGGCLRCDWLVIFETTNDVKLDDEVFWNAKINWVFENVFPSEQNRFRDALLTKKLKYDSAFSQEKKRTYVFIEPQSDTRNEYPGVDISEKGQVKKLEITWYLSERGTGV